MLSLAGRSADAAKEIKSLINASFEACLKGEQRTAAQAGLLASARLPPNPGMLAGMSETSRQDRTEWALLCAAQLVLGIALGYSLYETRQHIFATESDLLAVQAHVIDDNLGRQIQAVNQALLEVQATLAQPHAYGGDHAQARLLAALRRTIPGLRTMAHVRADGTVLASSHVAAVGTSHAERAYFKRARARPDPAMLHVAEPYRDAGGVWVITLVRTLSGSAGEFAGLVEVSLEPEYFGVAVGSVLYAPDMRAPAGARQRHPVF